MLTGFVWEGSGVARLIRQAGLKGVQKRRFRCTTRPGTAERWAPDLVERQFVAERPDALWVAYVTYVATLEGFLYLGIVLDVLSRLVVGWAMADRLASRLVLQALEMASSAAPVGKSSPGLLGKMCQVE